MTTKKKFIVKIYSSTANLDDLKAGDIHYAIYENISDLDTVEVKEVAWGVKDSE